MKSKIKYPEDLEKLFLAKLEHTVAYMYRIDGVKHVTKKRMNEIVNDTSIRDNSIGQSDARFDLNKFNWPARI